MSDDGRSDIELRLLSQPRYLCVARAAVAAAVEKIGFSEDESGRIVLAVDEALTNIIRHGYQNRSDGPIRLCLQPSDTRPPACRIVIEDKARQVDPESIRGRELADVRPGGLGVYCIRQIMDEVSYARRPGGGMRLVMTKTAAAPGHEAEPTA